jgi:hypothetical protein
MDDIDKAQHQIEQGLEVALRAMKNKEIDYNNIGECMDCGEVGRLIDSICVPCTRLQEEKEKKWRHV